MSWATPRRRRPCRGSSLTARRMSLGNPYSDFSNRYSAYVLDNHLLGPLLDALGVTGLRTDTQVGPGRVMLRGPCPACGRPGFYVGGPMEKFAVGWQCPRGKCHVRPICSLLGLVRAVLCPDEGGKPSLDAAVAWLTAFVAKHSRS